MSSLIAVCSLVPRLLSRLVALLPLEASRGAAAAQPALPLPATAAAAAAAEARAQGQLPEVVSWRFTKALKGAQGLAARDLAADMFRATLRALPASARSWFQSLRDKKLAQAVEVRGFILTSYSHTLFAQSLVPKHHQERKEVVLYLPLHLHSRERLTAGAAHHVMETADMLE